MSSIHVICRLRPENSIEKESGSSPCVSFNDTKISIKISDRCEDSHEFTFDRVFSSESRQIEVFEHSAKPVVEGVLDGYNGTIFAYGQTGSGKTYTMEGVISDPGLKGIIPRMMDALFESLVKASESTEFILRVSFLEIYLERIHDLLDTTKTNLQVKEDKLRGIYVQNSSQLYVSSPSEMMEVMLAGSANRSIAATRMNERSSRSHSIFCVNVEQKDSFGNKKTGRLYFIDLAGSESVGKTNVSGQQLKEAQMINKSLSALGNVINALTEKGSNFVPYRDSKLTRILQESIGGNSQTSLIITCSMSSYNDKETLGTLRFGQRAKKIQNKPVVNQEKSSKELQKVIENLQIEIKKQREIISKFNFYSSNCENYSKIEDLRIAGKSQELEARNTQYALTLLKQHIEVVKLNEELQTIKIEKKEIEDELSYRNKEMNELEANLAETQQNLLEEREQHKKISDEYQYQINQASMDLLKANNTFAKTVKICEMLQSDLLIISSEIPQGEIWSDLLKRSLKETLRSLITITDHSLDHPASKVQQLLNQKEQISALPDSEALKANQIKQLLHEISTLSEELNFFKSQSECLAHQLDTKVKSIEEERELLTNEIRLKSLKIQELQEHLNNEKSYIENLKSSASVAHHNSLKGRLEELTQERQRLSDEIVAMRRELDEREGQLHASLLKIKRLERQITAQSQSKPVSFSGSTDDLQIGLIGKVSKPIRGGGGNFSNFQRNNQIITNSSNFLFKRKSIEKIVSHEYRIQSKIKDLFGGLLG